MVSLVKQWWWWWVAVVIIQHWTNCGSCSGQHQGAIWDIDADFESKFLATACADSTSRIFEVTTGTPVATLQHDGYDSLTDLTD
jgi:WD40 repeat protein